MAAKLKLDLIVDDKGSVVVKKFSRTAQTSFNLAKAGAVGLGVGITGIATTSYAAGKAMLHSLGIASDLQEVTSKFEVVFAGQEAAAESWAKNMVDNYAMSRREAKQYLSSVQDLLVPMGMVPDKAGEMSNAVVKLSADLGSFNNLPTAQVMGDIQSALVGNFETMKKYGVVLNASIVQEKALAMGLAATKDQLTAAHKAQAAYALMVTGSTAAIGDMGRTSEGYANQLKEAGALQEDVWGSLGKALLPMASDALKLHNEQLKLWRNYTDENQVAIQNLTKDGVLYLVDGLVISINTMRFFHNAWQGIKLVGNMAITSIAAALEGLIMGLRVLLYPLDLLFQALVDLGKMEANPFDKLDKAAMDFRASSFDVTKSVIKDMEKTNKTYDGVIKQVKTWKKAIEKIPVAHAKTAKQVKKSTKEISGYYWDSYETMTDAEMKALEKVYYGSEEKKKTSRETTRAMTRDWEVFSASSAQGLISDFINPTKESFLDLGNFHGQLLTAMITNWVDLLAQMLVEQATFQHTSQAMMASTATTGTVTGAATLPSVASGAAMTAPVFGLNPLTGGLIGVGGGMMLGEATGAGQGEAFLGSAVGAALGGWLAAGTLLGGPLGAVLGGLAGGALSGIVDDVGDFVGDTFDAVGDFFGGIFHKGGMIKPFVKAHRGLFLKPDERPIIAQVGEGILNRQAVSRIGGEAGVNALNQGASLGGEMTIRVMFDDDRLRDLIRFEADGVRIEAEKTEVGTSRIFFN